MRLTALLAAAVLAIVIAGCGGDDSGTPQVPGPPADVTVPDSGPAPAEAASSSQDKNNSDSSTSSDDTSSSDSSSSDTGSTGTSDSTTGDTSTDTTGGGATAPDSQQDSASNDTAPPAGSDAQQFEDFCAQNPGAC
jgi:hypothetical protein